jgi:uncharacterized protein YbjT (DUF2867 family)
MTVTRTAFVAGATGYTGRALVRELAASGVRTYAHVRPDSPRLKEWEQEFSAAGAVADTTAWSEPAMTTTLSRVRPDAVFALLGTTRSRTAAAQAAGANDSYETVDYGLTALLLNATVRAAPSARFVYLSSLGVAPSARGEYLRVRWRMEEQLRNSGVAWTIARPSFITGADRDEFRPLERIGAAVTDGLLGGAGLLGAGRVRDRFSSMTATELARALARHAFDPGSSMRILSAEELR